MPPKPKTAEALLEFRTNILDAARDLFAEKGVEAVTMREIAKRIGYSATSIYHHFADKDAVLRAVCDADFLKLAQTQMQILNIANPVERLIAMGKNHAQFALNFPSHYRLMFLTPHPPCGPENSSLQHRNPEQDAYFQLKNIVQEMHALKLLRDDLSNVDLIAQTFFAGLHGVLALEIIMGKDTWVDWAAIEDRITLMMQNNLRAMLKESHEITI